MIDAHQHFWQVGWFDYPWMKRDNEVLYRDYLPAQLGATLTIDQIAGFINEEARANLVTFGGPPIPIAPAIDDSAIRRALGPLPSTPFQQGIRATMQRFAELNETGRLDTSDLS